MSDPAHKMSCMSCKMEHAKEFLFENTYTTFRKTYRNIVQGYVLDTEHTWMNDTRREILITQKKDELTKQLNALLQTSEDEFLTFETSREEPFEAMKLRERIAIVAGTDFVNCVSCDDGFMTDLDGCDNLTCMSCRQLACGKCKMAMAADHKCDEKVLEDIDYLQKTTKACPRCGVRCIKTEGCSQVICNECKHVFDYNTLQSEDHLNNHTTDSIVGAYEYIEEKVSGFTREQLTRFHYISDIWFETFDNPYYRIIRKSDNVFNLITVIGSHIFKSIVTRLVTVLDRKRLTHGDRVKYILKEITLEEFTEIVCRKQEVYEKNLKGTAVLAKCYVRIVLFLTRYLDAIHEDQPNLCKGVKFVPLYRAEQKAFISEAKQIIKENDHEIILAGMVPTLLRHQHI